MDCIKYCIRLHKDFSFLNPKSYLRSPPPIRSPKPIAGDPPCMGLHACTRLQNDRREVIAGHRREPEPEAMGGGQGGRFKHHPGKSAGKWKHRPHVQCAYLNSLCGRIEGRDCTRLQSAGSQSPARCVFSRTIQVGCVTEERISLSAAGPWPRPMAMCRTLRRRGGED